MADQVTTAATRKQQGASPILFFLLGVLFLSFWIIATLLQIQTSEAFILHGGAVTSLAANWSILMQPLDLARGQMSMDMAKATMWGWGIELAFLACVIGYEVTHEAVRGSSKRLAGWFTTCSILLIAFDGWTDFQYGSMASGFWGQVAFAGITTFIVAFFGVIGVKLMEHGFGEWNKP